MKTFGIPAVVLYQSCAHRPLLARSTRSVPVMHCPAFICAWTGRFTAPAPASGGVCRTAPQMGLVSHSKLEVVFETAESELAKYKFELEIPGKYSKERRRATVATMKKHADFKGFRKGTIPPFIMKDLASFVLRDSVSEMIDGAVKELQLFPLEGDAAEPDMDIEAMMKRFTVGEDFVFEVEMSLRKDLSGDGEDDGEVADDDIVVSAVDVVPEAEKDDSAVPVVEA